MTLGTDGPSRVLPEHVPGEEPEEHVPGDIPALLVDERDAVGVSVVGDPERGPRRRTSLRRSARFSSDGSDDLPGKVPSGWALRVRTRHPSSRKSRGLQTELVPFPGPRPRGVVTSRSGPNPPGREWSRGSGQPSGVRPNGPRRPPVRGSEGAVVQDLFDGPFRLGGDLEALGTRELDTMKVGGVVGGGGHEPALGPRWHGR